MYCCLAEGWVCSVLLQPQGQESQTPPSDLELEWKEKRKNLNTQVTGDGIGREERGTTLRTEERYGTDKE